MLKNDNLQIKTQALKLLVKILREAPKQLRDEIIKYTESEILNVKNFYVKRLYFIFFEECLEVFSFIFIKENKIFENIMRLLHENNEIMVNKFLKTLPKYYPYIYEDNKLKVIINNNVESCRKYMTKDKLIIENVRIFDKWLDNFLKNYDPDDYRQYLKLDKVKNEKENKSITNKEIVFPSYNHVFII